VSEASVPAAEVVDKVVVEHTGADLEEQCAPRAVQRICCFFTIRLLTTWLMVDSARELAMTSPAR